jgi:hypothetical protein
MSLLTQVSIPDALIIFFLTLGPLKALGTFSGAARTLGELAAEAGLVEMIRKLRQSPREA